MICDAFYFYSPYKFRGLSMPAQILTLYDELLRLGPAVNDQNFNIGPFDMSDLNTDDTTLRAILAFRLKAVETVHLTMAFNGRPNCIDYNFNPPEPNSTRPRSWHEIIPASDLRKQQNNLVIGATGSGHVEISDIVVLYHSAS